MKLQQKTIEQLTILINERTQYRTGKNLVNFFNNLGFQDTYYGGFPSRGDYTESMLNRINGTEKIEECIKQLFAPINFIGRFQELDQFISEINQYLGFDNYKVVRDRKIIKIIHSDEDIILNENNPLSEDEFLKQEFKDISIHKLNLDNTITEVLEQRMQEIEKCLNSKSALATIFLCGSTLEGILLGIAINNHKTFNSAIASPKDKDRKTLKFHDWKLSNFIDVAKETGFLKEDVKQFSHALRNFRNYIHPYEQASQKFNPDEHTAKICFQVLKAAIYQITKREI